MRTVVNHILVSPPPIYMYDVCVKAARDGQHKRDIGIKDGLIAYLEDASPWWNPGCRLMFDGRRVPLRSLPMYGPTIIGGSANLILASNTKVWLIIDGAVQSTTKMRSFT